MGFEPRAMSTDSLLHNTTYASLRSRCFKFNLSPVHSSSGITTSSGGVTHATVAMSRPLTRQSIEAALAEVLPPGVTIRRLDLVPSSAQSRAGRLQRVYRARTSDGRAVCLVLPPPQAVRLLRAEQWLSRTEAAVVEWLQSLGSIQSARDLRGLGTTDNGRAIIPRLVAHVPAAAQHNALRVAYNIIEMPAGRPLSALRRQGGGGGVFSHQLQQQQQQQQQGLHALPPQERAHVAHQVGQLCRHLANFTSPSGRFGPALAVLAGPSVSGASSPALSAYGGSSGGSSAGGERGGGGGGRGGGGLPTIFDAAGGLSSWATTFQSLLEGVLRDGEDMAVTLPYSAIRAHFRRLSPCLDGVVRPRLVVVDAAADSNVLVADADWAANFSGPGAPGEDDERDALPGQDPAAQAAGAPLTVTGLLDWGAAFFGDPLFAAAFSGGSFSSSATPDRFFFEGFSGRPLPPLDGPAADSDEAAADDDDNDDDGARSSASAAAAALPGPLPAMIDAPATAPARRLLYSLYHHASDVVREFYRPSHHPVPGSLGPELQARRRLNEALRALDELHLREQQMAEGREGTPPAQGGSRHRRPSGDLSPAKKQRVRENGGR